MRSNSNLSLRKPVCRPSIFEASSCQLVECGHSLGVAMVAPQQAYQAASFGASLCAIKSDLPALVACLVRTRTQKSAALILSHIQPFLQRTQTNAVAPAEGARRSGDTGASSINWPHHRPMNLFKVQRLQHPRFFAAARKALSQAATYMLFREAGCTMHRRCEQNMQRGGLP